MKITFLILIAFCGSIISLCGEILPEKRKLSEIKSSDIPTGILEQFEGYLLPEELITSYKKYKKEGVIPNGNKLLLSLPQNYKAFFNSSSDSIINPAHMIPYLNNYFSISNNTKQANVIIGMLVCDNGRNALLRNIAQTFIRYQSSARPNTWNCKDVSVLETPFDFTANYCPGKQLSLDASYYNLMFAIQVDDSNLKEAMPLTELNTIMNRFIDLFHGYEKAEKIIPVEYLNCAITTDKDSVIKVTWNFKEEFKKMSDQFWILAVVDKGNLSMNPGAVFIKIPEKERAVTLTFYFISEDGKSYSAQVVKIKATKK